MHHAQYTQRQVWESITFVLIIDRIGVSALVQMQWTEGNQHL